MGKALGIVVAVLGVWGALAQIMPDTFQMTREKHRKLMAVVFGQQSIWIALMVASCLIGWYVWNLEGRIGVLSTIPRLSPSSTTAQQQGDQVGVSIVGWTADESSCTAVVDASKVSQEMQQKFDMAIVCGFADPKADMMKDTRITISQLFTVQPAVRIATTFSKSMADALSADQDLILTKIQPPPKHGTPIQETNQIWIKIILVPKGFDTLNIHKLSDVPSNGGRISDGLAAVNIMKVATAK